MLGALPVQLPETPCDSVRMGFLHSSRTGGRLFKALRAASGLRFIDVSSTFDRITDLRFEMPLFGEAAPEWFAQGEFWDDGPGPEQTAFDLLADALVDSDHCDQPLLRRVHRHGALFEKGLERVPPFSGFREEKRSR